MTTLVKKDGVAATTIILTNPVLFGGNGQIGSFGSPPESHRPLRHRLDEVGIVIDSPRLVVVLVVAYGILYQTGCMKMGNGVVCLHFSFINCHAAPLRHVPSPHIPHGHSVDDKISCTFRQFRKDNLQHKRGALLAFHAEHLVETLLGHCTTCLINDARLLVKDATLTVAQPQVLHHVGGHVEIAVQHGYIALVAQITQQRE